MLKKWSLLPTNTVEKHCNFFYFLLFITSQYVQMNNLLRVGKIVCSWCECLPVLSSKMCEKSCRSLCSSSSSNIICISLSMASTSDLSNCTLHIKWHITLFTFISTTQFDQWFLLAGIPVDQRTITSWYTWNGSIGTKQETWKCARFSTETVA